MARSDHLSPYKTSIRNGDGKTFVRFHQTDVITFTADYVILRTGGWRSVIVEQVFRGFSSIAKLQLFFPKTGLR